MLFRTKKMIIFILAAMIPLLVFIGISYFAVPLLESIITFIALSIFTYFLLEKMINSPILEAIEGKANLVFGYTTTGSIIPFVMKPKENHLIGNLYGRFIKAPMDRSLLTFLEPPRQGTMEIKNNKIQLELDTEKFYNSKFNLNGIGVFLYSMKMNSFITKEFFSDEENKNLARHQIIQLNTNIDELGRTLTDFARAYVELLRPKDSIFNQPWFRAALIILGVIVLGYFLYPTIVGFLGTASDTVATSAGGLQSPQAILK